MYMASVKTKTYSMKTHKLQNTAIILCLCALEKGKDVYLSLHCYNNIMLAFKNNIDTHTDKSFIKHIVTHTVRLLKTG